MENLYSCFLSNRAMKLSSNKRRLFLLLGLLILALIIMIMSMRMHLEHHWIHGHETLAYSTTFDDEGLPPKIFLYLTQTETCIPNYFLRMDVIGDELACDCRIIVLSYQSKCLVDPPSHVKYISSNTSTTYTTGRSLLYTTAMSRPVDYLYYIFLDDDVFLYTKDKHDNINPWRWFESVLKRTQPTLAAVDSDGPWHIIDKIERLRLEKDCTLDASLTYNYLPGIYFDAIINAFHGKAIRHILGPILPYWSKFDNVSWWFNQWYVFMITDVTFRGQAVLLSRVMTKNDLHRPYIRKRHDASVLQSIADDIRKVIPEKYVEVADVLLKTWVANYTVEPLLTSLQEAYCKEPHLPNSNIVPFGWAEGV